MNKILFSSNSDEWSTPQYLFDELNNEFAFTLDPCADESNAKCAKFFTKNDNGLLKDWGGGNSVFCNPPYSQINVWVAKCFNESIKPNTNVVMLIPARTDTKYFHNYILNHSEIRFIRGRLKFGNSKNSAPFPSMIVIYRAIK